MNEKDVLLLKFRKHNDLTQEKMGEILGIAKSSYSSIENGVSKLTTENLKKLHQHLGLNPTWYITGGEGEMIVERDDNNRGEKEGELKVADLVKLSAAKLPETGESRPIPIYDIRASAGNTELLLPQELTVENILHIPELKGCDFAVKAYGCSMEPLIMDGDLLACRQIHDRNRLQDGHIYLIGTATNLYVKYLYAMPESLILTSENKIQKPIQLNPSDVLQVYEVVWGVRLTKL